MKKASQALRKIFPGTLKHQAEVVLQRQSALAVELLEKRGNKYEYANSQCPMFMQKNWKRYFGTVSRGEPKRLQGENSEVSLNIPSGSPGVYICGVHTDHSQFIQNGIIPESEYIAGPFVEFKVRQLQISSHDEIQNMSDTFFEIYIPHCVSERHLWKDVKVRHGKRQPGDDSPEVVYQDIPTKVTGENFGMDNEIDEKFIKISTKKFCHFICTVCKTPCSSKTVVFLYGKLSCVQNSSISGPTRKAKGLRKVFKKTEKHLPSEGTTTVEIKAFLCCELYSIADYESVSFFFFTPCLT